MFFHFQEGVCPVCLEGKGLPCCKGKIMALSLCAYKEVQCPNAGCAIKLLSQNLKEHVEVNCLFKKAACLWCGVSISQAEQQVSRLGL